MKHFKKFFSYLVALTMVLSLAAFTGVKVHADDKLTQSGLSINITAKEKGHTYEAYQIFKGDVDKNGSADSKKLSNIFWGNAISAKSSEFVAALKDDATIKNDFAFEEGKTVEAKDVAEKLAKLNTKNDANKLNAFAKLAANYLDKDKAHESTYNEKNKNYTISGLDAGYYLVQDKAGSITDTTNDTETNKNRTDKAYTAYILNVVGDIDVTAKSDVTTVDKLVEQFTDNTNKTGDEGNKFQKNADHEIGKTFKFKLAATVPADVHVSSYDSYKLKFNDTMSKGITFEGIDSVVLSDGTNNATVNPYSESNKDGYKTEGLTNDKGANALTNGGSWSLTINDIKKYSLNLSNEITATVIYNAKLNKDAKVNIQTPDATTNQNKVDLQYSNNPNAESLGRTEDHKVYVFTYGINNKKTKDEVAGDPLEGAEFKVYRGNVKSNTSEATPLTFKKDDDGHYVLSSDSDASATVTSNKDSGRFDLYGLDEGTYTIEETKSPAGYSKVDPFTITITATLGESGNDNQTSFAEKKDDTELTGELTADKTSKEYLNIIADKSGSTLPSTGGMGTTLLYVAGGILVACAAAYVVMSRKHSTNK